MSDINLHDLELQSRLNRISTEANTRRTVVHYTCVDCEEDLPQLRIEMKKSRCVQCQTDYERSSCRR